jgi:uncharacterized membrane protein required for colicin V production
MNIIDAIIILIVLMGFVVGFRRGFVRETTILVGLILSFVLAFTFKNPVAGFMYDYLPFFSFWGIFKGVTVLNILLYELIAFFLILGLFMAILQVFTFFSAIIEKILNFTIVGGFLSKILGGVVGMLSASVVAFLILFILTLPAFKFNLISKSELAPQILSKSPFLSNMMNDTVVSFNDIYKLKDKYKSNINTDSFNRDALDIMLKNKIVTVESVEKLATSGKLKVSGISDILKKYR